MTSDVARRRFREIVAPNLDAAYRLAKWLMRDGADAEDVVQDAALRALAALSGAEPLKPRAWWLSVVRNTALTALARRKGRAFVDLDEETPEDAPDPEAGLIARDEGARVRAAIASLPLALRETLVLREIEDLDYRAIAEATESPIGTVMSRLARARAALAQKLGKRE